jgi:formylglycine-generating enzyme required for sulfatase activity
VLQSHEVYSMRLRRIQRPFSPSHAPLRPAVSFLSGWLALLGILLAAAGCAQPQRTPAASQLPALTLAVVAPTQMPVVVAPTQMPVGVAPTFSPALPIDTPLPRPSAQSPTLPLPTPATAATSTLPPLQPGAMRTTPLDGMVQVYVPAGTFLLGSGATDPEALPDEFPQRRADLPGFWIDRSEVSNSQYALCVQAGRCRPPYYMTSSTRSTYYGDPRYADYPVILVGWAMANTYCQWVDRRLPSEAEWEKAARGTDGRIYPWGNQLSSPLANFCDRSCPFTWKDPRFDDGYSDTAPVDSFPGGASPYGALNMAGNAWEWTADWYAPIPGEAPAVGQQRVLKGGTWFYEPRRIRAAARGKADPGYMSNLIGFRCAQ